MVICKNCGKEFISKDTHKNRERKYCSQKCMGEANRKKDTQKCLNCGNDFIPVGKTRVRKFCSQKCSLEYHTGENSTNWRGGGVKLTCVICGTEYHTTKCQAEKYNSKCCSVECLNIYKKTVTGECGSNWRGGKIKRICRVCGNEFYRYPSQAKGIRGNLCSAGCRGVELILNNPNKETIIEIIVASILEELNIKFERQKSIGSFVADFYIQKYNLVIEADGDYFHDTPKAKNRDNRKNHYLLNNGYKLLRIRENDIHENAMGIITQYLNSLQQGTGA